MIRKTVKKMFRSVGYDAPRRYRNPIKAQIRAIGEYSEPTVFDIGAFTGQTASEYTLAMPTARVYAFEPFPDSYAKLSERANDNALLSAFQLAMGSTVGHADFNVNRLHATNSLLARPSQGKKYYPAQAETIDRIRVPMETVDHFCAEREIESVELLKLDVQGAELQVLEGASNYLSAGRIGAIYVEVAFVAHYEGQPLFCDVASRLERDDYSLFAFFESIYAPDGQLRYADALFVRPDARNRLTQAANS